MANIVVQGRELDEAQLQAIQALVDGNPSWSRRRLADALVQGWDWRNAAGRLKDMSCRRMLARLEAKGLVRLPARRRESPKRKAKVIAEVPGLDRSEWAATLAEVQPVSLEQVGYGTATTALFDHLLARYHYLGYAYPVGANVRYLARGRDGRVLACAVWASAALKVGCRDQWLGWTSPQRLAGLARVANNTRFLIMPWVRVSLLASHLLGLMTRRLAHDWRERTGQRLALVETFVDESRFQGTCYRAANWLDLGRTTGRTRDDRYSQIQVPTKRVLVLPLQPLARLRRELAG
jgi:Domain of unknown function (DUF4338)